MNITSVIAGLGNAGKEYYNTRHNVGFYCIDILLEFLDKSSLYTVSNLSMKKFNGVFWKVTDNKNIWIICKPTTYMNRSGECISPLLSYYSLSPSSLLVIHDDLDIPLGTMKTKQGGGDAGHNGLRSITTCLQTPNYSRMRIGIGRPTTTSVPIVNWVLAKFTAEERNVLSLITPTMLEIIENFIYQRFTKGTYDFKQ